MKGLFLTIGLLVNIGGYAQGPEFQAPFLSPKFPMEDFRRTPGPQDPPPFHRFNDINRNQNIIIFMVNDNAIRHYNHWRIWHKLKERKRERIIRKWQRRHDRNNTMPEFLRRGHR